MVEITQSNYFKLISIKNNEDTRVRNEKRDETYILLIKQIEQFIIARFN